MRSGGLQSQSPALLGTCGALKTEGEAGPGLGGSGEEGGEREGENVRQGELACILEEGTAQK